MPAQGRRIGHHGPCRLQRRLLWVALMAILLANATRMNIKINKTDFDTVGGNGQVKLTTKTKTLVTTQLASVKSDHYTTYLGPSWRRLAEGRKSTEEESVQPDFFIACVDEACNQLEDEGYCHKLDSTDITSSLTELLRIRKHDELLCYFASVEEKADEEYVFLHSLNYLEMEAFQSILKLKYYDYVLRTDADAILFPGLLYMTPAGADGWIGSGFSGVEVTPHLIRHFAEKLMPELGEPLRNITALGSMQSTFYVNTRVLDRFVAVLIKATRALYSSAFTDQVCADLEKTDFVKKLFVSLDSVCLWPSWMRGVSSLYGTRIAADYVLRNATVSDSLDAMGTEPNSHDRPVRETIQVHLIGLKHLAEWYPPDVSICNDPERAVSSTKAWIEEVNKDMGRDSTNVLDAMLSINRPANATTLHREVAKYVYDAFRSLHGCNSWTFHHELQDSFGGNSSAVQISEQNYDDIRLEIEWSKRIVEEYQNISDAKDELEREYNALLRNPIISNAYNDFCEDCVWRKKATCSHRLDYLTAQYGITPLQARVSILEKSPQCKRTESKRLSDRQIDDLAAEYSRLFNNESLPDIFADFCPGCIINDSKVKGTTCEQTKGYFISFWKIHPLLAPANVVFKHPQCADRSSRMSLKAVQEIVKSFARPGDPLGVWRGWCADCNLRADGKGAICDEEKKKVENTEIPRARPKIHPFLAPVAVMNSHTTCLTADAVEAKQRITVEDHISRPHSLEKWCGECKAAHRVQQSMRDFFVTWTCNKIKTMVGNRLNEASAKMKVMRMHEECEGEG
mmetsp:Transcript_24751/g.55994  ORF Transcript_24751/g.55994 Transcript_24751/m.55994 type:complete len:797 (+) Transcript_24751:122-2512(+)